MLLGVPERLLAWRYMRSKRREGFVSLITLFSMLGIMLGVATLILVMSLMNGIRAEMMQNFVGIGGHVSVYAQKGKPIVSAEALKTELAAVSGVQHVAQRVEGQVMASSKYRALGAQVIGFTQEGLAQKEKLSQSIVSGELGAFESGAGILMGQRLADNLGVRVGDSITLISPRGRATFAGFVPRIKAYPIRGTFDLGMHMIDGSTILMPYEDAAVYFQLPKKSGGAASSLSIDIAVPEQAEVVAAHVAEQLGSGYRVYDFKRSNQGILAALNVQRDVMVVILALIVLVAAFNIISSLVMLVQDKSKDIAVLRSMGASRSMVMHVFMLSGMAIGLVGTALGLGLGVLAATYIDALREGLEVLMGQELLVGDIYFLSSLPTRMDASQVMGVVLFSLAISFGATLYPAWKAARLEPAEALRYE